MILSFGLLGPGKGYESAIAAMPAVVRADPTALYVIVGATHPELIRREGRVIPSASWRSSRRRSASPTTSASSGASSTLAELGLWLEAADIFVTPYPNLEQIVSGTLSYAMGAGKAIVSTPYAYASERLAHGRGRLVAAGSTEALADGLVELALSSERRAEHGRLAYAYSRGMHWPEVGAAYRQIFGRVGAVRVHANSVASDRGRSGDRRCLIDRSSPSGDSIWMR